jgi:DNA-binding response OmpR family regulator
MIGLSNTGFLVDSSIPTPIPLRPRSSPVPVAVARIGSQALQIAVRPQALIVDDCRFIAERVARVLEAKGFECTLATDGYKGFELLRGRRFDLFVLDVDVPMIDGFSLLRRLRCDAVHTDTPVLMLSTEPSETDHDRAVALGATGILRKPLQLRPLNQMLDAIVK